ncbi:ATP-binding protein [Candidatus Woesearchaeota archaeon]|nr:ATP-binding protein [Candidatus Woesearchaeota archaeon]
MGLFSKLTEQDKAALKSLEGIIGIKRIKLIKKLLKEKKISLEIENLETSIAGSVEFPQIKSKTDEVDASEVNEDIKEAFEEKLFRRFSEEAFEKVTNLIAPEITGLDYVKKAAAIQLFSTQPIHLLLLGDPGTGKTDILRSTFSLSPVSSFGLGSGTSGAGLVVTVRGREVMKGLLPLADQGICCIDELNLMKEDSRAGLYNAMEKGFVTYDKAGLHYKFDARAKILATANPKGDKFTGKNMIELKRQLPFDSALLTRFHLVYFIRRPDLKRFKKITEHMVAGEKKEANKDDIKFIKDYIEYTKSVGDIGFPKPMQGKVVDFIAELKRNESKYLVEISPRMTIGFMRLCKGLARMERRGAVEEKDIERVKEIVRESLKIE